MGDKSGVTPMDRVRRSLEAARERVLGGNVNQKVLSFSPSGSTSSTARESKEADLPAQNGLNNTSSQSSEQRQQSEREEVNIIEANRELPLDLEKEDFPPLVGGAMMTPKTIHGESQDSQSSKTGNSGGEIRDNGKTPDDLIKSGEGTMISVPQTENKDQELSQEEPGLQGRELALVVRSPAKWSDVLEEEMVEHSTRGLKGRPMDPDGTPDKGNNSKRRILGGQPPPHQRVESFSQLLPVRLEWGE
ncbi:hypothetical protein R1sor_000687 [Riccia sorocarpa]|uniref:Uncharacterized protein n=1 Tax=Riccia sorocarpa TaxID=122646 RepID=A0ABD3GTT8_9MARC